ncbi:hypothetical protein EIP91_011790 [Steccherinum ochraceum]|uniref:FAD/NAD(P)-binding domain-containing protein n=1 Tax=Steccherinum ochraceum TaxID=92696 RepID=A0A4R0RK76_9APHY|nr:hypothetical protein EIP91_011790 [Steccherinum ochraceum]
MVSEKPASAAPSVVIIGAGIAGIITAIALKKRLGFHDFKIYEEADDVGGTWHLNTYPGCACDIATHWYSYSEELNPDWDHSHVYQPVLKAYWKGLAERYGITRHVCFFSRVLGAAWDTQQQMYRVEVLDVRNGDTQVEYTNAIVSAVGFLNQPYFAENLKGVRDTFKGEHFHSARWDHSVDLRHKRVAVIGNSNSASQFLPIITNDPTTQVTSFYRTSRWIIPEARAKLWIPANIRWRIPIPGWQRSMFKRVPLAMRLYRWMLIIGYEFFYASIISGSPNRESREALMEVDLRQYIRETAPTQYHAKLIPDYPFGCKRFVLDSGHLKALHRPNVDINFDGIAGITEHGIITKKGEHVDFDVIIEATGYVVDQYRVQIRGRDGSTIQEYFDHQAGPTAYKGTTVPNFPNFFMVCGPNTATSHGSVICTQELQINYIIQMLQPVLAQQVSSFEVTHDATNAWNESVQRKLADSVWSACSSWYRVGQTGKNTSIWPGSLTHQWLHLRRPAWSDYRAVEAAEWERRRLWRRVLEIMLILVIAVALLWIWMHPTDGVRVVEAVNRQVPVMAWFLASDSTFYEAYTLATSKEVEGCRSFAAVLQPGRTAQASVGIGSMIGAGLDHVKYLFACKPHIWTLWSGGRGGDLEKTAEKCSELNVVLDVHHHFVLDALVGRHPLLSVVATIPGLPPLWHTQSPTSAPDSPRSDIDYALPVPDFPRQRYRLDDGEREV